MLSSSTGNTGQADWLQPFLVQIAEARGVRPGHLRRLLRLLAATGIFEEPQPGEQSLGRAAAGSIASLTPVVRLPLLLERFGAGAHGQHEAAPAPSQHQPSAPGCLQGLPALGRNCSS